MKPACIKRVYQLYHGPSGVTPQSNVYARYSKDITRVAAVSIKQAVYLGSQREWSDGKRAGIIAVADGHRWEDGWRLYDGTVASDTPWKHYQRFRPLEDTPPQD